MLNKNKEKNENNSTEQKQQRIKQFWQLFDSFATVKHELLDVVVDPVIEGRDASE